jgi:hypothetical protein
MRGNEYLRLGYEGRHVLHFGLFPPLTEGRGFSQSDSP